MASLRRVRKDFRKEVLRSIQAGDGNIEKLVESAGKHFGYDVGYEALIKSFLHSEVGHAVSYLRNDGLIETVGKQWKQAIELNDEDLDIISIRRLKRMRGELKAAVKLAHDHGRIDDATAAADLLARIETRMSDAVPSHESEVESQ